MCSGEEQFEQFWKWISQNTILSSLKSAQCLQSRYCLIFFLFLLWRPFSCSRVKRKIWYILIEDLSINNPIKFGYNVPCSNGGNVVWRFFVLFCFVFFSSGTHFVQQSGTIWAILVENLPRNNSINFGWNPPRVYRAVIWNLFFFFFFLALVVILCANLSYFGREPPKEHSY